MEDILEHIDTQRKRFRTLFSVLSFSLAMVTIVIFFVFAIYNANVQTAKSIPHDIRAIVKAMLINMTIGFVFAVASVVRKEKLKYFKAIGAILNIGLFLVVFGWGIFSVIMDRRKAAHTTQQQQPVQH